MYESISKNNELENEMTLDMSYFWYSDAAWCRGFEFKSGCEQRVNPIYIFKTRVISSMKELARTK